MYPKSSSTMAQLPSGASLSMRKIPARASMSSNSISPCGPENGVSVRTSFLDGDSPTTTTLASSLPSDCMDATASAFLKGMDLVGVLAWDWNLNASHKTLDPLKAEYYLVLPCLVVLTCLYLRFGLKYVHVSISKQLSF